jgi:hypothetical protein
MLIEFREGLLFTEISIQLVEIGDYVLEDIQLEFTSFKYHNVISMKR